MNSKKTHLILLLILVTMFLIYSFIMINESIPVTSFGQTINSSAKAMSVIEVNSGRELFKKDSNSKLAMASTTKIMTALVTIENCKNFDEIVKIDKRAIGIEGTSIYLTDKENLTVKDLLYGLILASGNDASVALASHFGRGDINNFVSMMNQKAIEIGALNTCFKNPHGLDEEGHFTTANDLAKITGYALKNDIFREIVSTKNKVIPGNEKVEARYLKNKEKLLTTYPDCIGVKTGFTDNAGRCNVSAVERDNMLVVCVVLNCPDMFEESVRLFDEVFKNYKMINIIPSYNFVTQVVVNGSNIKKVNTFSKKEFNYPLTDIEKSFIIISNDLPESLDAPIWENTKVGTITVTLNNEIVFEDSIYTMDSAEKEYIKNEIEKIIDNWTYSYQSSEQ